MRIRWSSLRGVSGRAGSIALAAVLAAALTSSTACAQNEGDLGTCTLKNHIYTCDGAAFEKALTAASTVSFKTHNPDGIARNVLQDLAEKKLHKTVVPDGAPADMVFLLMPLDQGGQIESNTSLQDLGSLRIYSANPDGTPAHLLWAEAFQGEPDMSWTFVARNIEAKFLKRFHIK